MVGKKDFYEVLGVSQKAPAKEIKQAYRKQALQYHPDKNKDSGAEAKFKEINEAYQILSDPEKKQAYDQFGHSAFAPGGAGGPFSQTHKSGPFTYTYTTSGARKAGGMPFGFDFSDPFEIFEQFFGGASPFRRGPQLPRYGITIEFMEAIKGVEKRIIHRGKEKIIKIPAGADDGTRIKFQDFYVTIEVKNHPTFKRDGSDIFIDYEISFSLAALGGKIEVPTVDGLIKLKIRPGTQPGTLVRLRGRGAPRVHSSARGNQYIRLLVKVPSRLNRKQKELLKKLEQIF